MTNSIEAIIERLHEAERELDAEVARVNAKLQFGLERGKVVFEQEVLRRHRELKTGVLTYIRTAHPLVILTAPFIYALIVPLAIFDVFLAVYQAVCFPAYGIAKVRRADYMIFDRRYLAYLNIIEKVNCAFCSYANGLIAYAAEISSRTEQYWCPIKHARRTMGSHWRYRSFVAYGDADAYQAEKTHPHMPMDEVAAALPPKA